MKKTVPVVICLFFAALVANGLSYPQPLQTNMVEQTLDDTQYHTTYVESYYSDIQEDVDLDTLQCPIPMSCRVKNYTRIQCVFSSIEMIGRWADEPKLMKPPLTSRDDCKSYSGPTDAGRKLTRLGVNFTQVYSNRPAALALIKQAMAEGRGCLFSIPRHAMVLVHYSEEENRVCWVDNSDYSLKVHTGTIQKFNSMWDGWVLVVHADKDIIPRRLYPITSVDIVDENKNSLNLPQGYIPLP